MGKQPLPPSPGGGEILVYQTEDGRVKLQVRLENETVWLTQQLMAELFQTTQQNISQHIQNIFEEGELTPEGTYKKFLLVRREGGREVRRSLDYYSLDMIDHLGRLPGQKLGGHPVQDLGHPAVAGIPRQGLHDGR